MLASTRGKPLAAELRRLRLPVICELDRPSANPLRPDTLPIVSNDGVLCARHFQLREAKVDRESRRTLTYSLPPIAAAPAIFRPRVLVSS
jgi:hypothetical protein